MGLFSYNCECCGHPMLAPHATNRINAWMNQVVVIKYGRKSPLVGSYDGYGRVMGAAGGDIGYPMRGTVYHEACWKAAGSPPEYKGPSANAECQGHFFAEGAHDMVEPGMPATAPTRVAVRPNSIAPTCHKDGSVTYWAVYLQSWERRVRIVPNHELAAMNARDRLRIIRHFANHMAQFVDAPGAN